MTGRTTGAFSFAGKLLAAGLLAALADYLFYGAPGIGATIGVFALAWAVLLFVAVPGVRRRGALVAIGLAILFGALLIEDPSLLGWTLFWTALSSAAVLSRHRFDDALRWFQRLMLHVSFGLIRPFGELRRLHRTRAPGKRFDFKRALSVFALPVVGGAMFLALFAGANPIISNLFARVHAPDGSVFLHAGLWFLIFMAVWPSLRPHPRVTTSVIGEASLEAIAPKVPLLSITLSLLTFNALFAMQNVLDILFLWSGAPLPGTLTMAEYAHRGAYLLIVTALLAGLFVLLVLRPGSESVKRPAIRAMVALWVAQNILLVASSILRTLNYVGSYSLTELRIWALGWMGLVGVGLALVCWRLLRDKSAAWLINANALAAAVLLTAVSIVDAGEVSAWWNVRHAREVGGRGVEIDLCYLSHLGPSAALPLIDLEGRVKGQPQLLDRVRAVRDVAMVQLVAYQWDWHGWTWRNARRLQAAQALLGPKPLNPAQTGYGRECDGSPTPPPPVTEAPPIEMPPPVLNATSEPAADGNAVTAPPERSEAESRAAASALVRDERR